MSWQGHLFISFVTDISSNPVSGIKVGFLISTYPAGSREYELTKPEDVTDSEGKAETQLKLGDIPAEYGVTAKCDVCIPSSVTFTCCGKLQNDDFKQFDIKWATDTYDNTNKTIKELGCIVTSLATLINYYINEYDLNVATTNPLSLNKYMKENSYYTSEGKVKWSVVQKVSNNQISFVKMVDISTITPVVTTENLIKEINEDLFNKKPVVLKIKGFNAPSHFVLAVGKCGTRYIISDPGSSQRFLYDPYDKNYSLLGIRRFEVIRKGEE